jgi:hypothetical protein
MLVWLGVQSLRHAGAPAVIEPRRGRAFRDGLATSLANPKLAVFFVALFPQFIGARGDDAGDGRDDRRLRPHLVHDAGGAREPRQGRLHGVMRGGGAWNGRRARY